MANKVLFYRGLYEKYNASEMPGVIYFATDLGEIWIDGKRYGGENQQLVQDVSLSDGNLLITYNTYSDGVQDNAIISISEIMQNFSEATSESAGLMSAEDKIALDALKNSFDTTYVPNESLLSVMSAEHGALSANTGQYFKDAKLSFSEMFDAILFPTINPVIVLPSASIMINDSDKNIEVGKAIPTYTINYNPGEVKLGDIIQHTTYAGEKTNEVVTITDNLIAGQSPMPAKTIVYSATVNFASGINQPMTNKNEIFGNICEAGSVSADITIYPYYNYYASTGEKSEVIEQPILRNAGISSVTTPDLELAPHTALTPQVVKLPIRTMKKLQMYNTFSGKYEDVSFVDWHLTTEQIDNTIYNVYTYTGVDRSSVKIKITF